MRDIQQIAASLTTRAAAVSVNGRSIIIDARDIPAIRAVLQSVAQLEERDGLQVRRIRMSGTSIWATVGGFRAAFAVLR